MREHNRYKVRRKAFKKSRHKKAIGRMNTMEFLRTFVADPSKAKMEWQGDRWIVVFQR